MRDKKETFVGVATGSRDGDMQYYYWVASGKKSSSLYHGRSDTDVYSLLSEGSKGNMILNLMDIMDAELSGSKGRKIIDAWVGEAYLIKFEIRERGNTLGKVQFVEWDDWVLNYMLKKEHTLINVWMRGHHHGNIRTAMNKIRQKFAVKS